MVFEIYLSPHLIALDKQKMQIKKLIHQYVQLIWKRSPHEVHY